MRGPKPRGPRIPDNSATGAHVGEWVQGGLCICEIVILRAVWLLALGSWRYHGAFTNGEFMGDPISSFSHEHSVILGCPHLEGAQPCYIPLPLQSPLGKYEGLRYQPMGEWPLVFLCLWHARVYECRPDSIHLETDMRLPGQPVSPLWRIECDCAHENCGKLHTIYTAREKDWPTIVRLILKRNPIVPCGDHDLVWREDLMRGTEYPHIPPVR
jgi:hypothetical protein